MDREVLFKKISELEKNSRLKLSPKEKEAFLIDYSDFLKSLKRFDAIEIEHVEAVDFPFKVFSSNLREDEVFQEVDYKKLLENSKNVKGNYFILKKVNDEK